MSIEPSSIFPSPAEVDPTIKKRIETTLGRRSLFTTNRGILVLTEQIAQEKGIKPIKVKVTETGFNPNTELVRIFEEGIPSETIQALVDKYGKDWFDEISFNIEHIRDEGIDPSTFSAFIEVAPDVNPQNPAYSKFSNELRWLNQSVPGFETVLYAPADDLVHTEFRVRSQSIE